MQRSIRDILFIFLGIFVSAGLVWAARGGLGVRLNGDVVYLNALGHKETDARAMERLMLAVFRTTPARIVTLRAEGMGEGDVAAALAAASRMPRGVTDASLARITQLWKAPSSNGWAGIVERLGVSADRVALDVERVKPPTARSQ